MKIYMKIYLIVDGFGNKASVVCEDESDDVTIHGLQDNGENLVNFDSEAWSIPMWCKTHGFECKVRSVEMPFDVCWKGDWFNTELHEKKKKVNDYLEQTYLIIVSGK